MAIIGPRPLLVRYLDRYNEEQRHRHDVRPGLTGYAQAHGRNAVSCYVASDVPAILKYTRNVYYIGNLEMARLANGAVTFYNLDGDEIEKKPTQIKWDAEAAEKAGYEHFMLKEIHEQPKAVQDTLNSVLKDGAIDLSSMGLTEEELQSFSQIYIVACRPLSLRRREGQCDHRRPHSLHLRKIHERARQAADQHRCHYRHVQLRFVQGL